MKQRIEWSSLTNTPNLIGTELTVNEVDCVYYGPVKTLVLDQGGFVTITLSSAERVGICDEHGAPSSNTTFHFPSSSHLSHIEGQ